MQITKSVQQEIIALLMQGYSIKSVIFAMSKKYKNVEFKQSDILILAKRNNIKVGNRDITKEKVDLKTITDNLPTLLNDKSFMGEIKNKLIILAVCLLVLLGVLYFFTGWKIALGVFGGLVLVAGIAVLILYLKYVKPNKQLQSSFKKKGKNSTK